MEPKEKKKEEKKKDEKKKNNFKKYLMSLIVFGIISFLSFLVVYFLKPEIWSGYVFGLTIVWSVIGVIYYVIYGCGKKENYASKVEDLNNDLSQAVDDLAMYIKRNNRTVDRYDQVVREIGRRNELLKKEIEDPIKNKLEDNFRNRIKQEIVDLEDEEAVLFEIRSNYQKKVISPRKNNGDDAYCDEVNPNGFYVATDKKANDTDNPVDHVTDIAAIKKSIRNLEQSRVGKFTMPIVISAIFVGLYLLLSFVIVIENPDSKDLLTNPPGSYSNFLVILMGFGLVVYSRFSFVKVQPNHNAVWFWMGKAFFSMDRGIIPTPKWLAQVVKMPTSRRWFNLYPDDVIMTGEEGQSLKFDPSVPWRIKNVWDVIAGIGLDFDKNVVPFLEGNPKITRKNSDGKDERSDFGAIGDTVNNTIREYVADKSNVNSLEKALNIRRPLIELLSRSLKDEFSQLGIDFGDIKIPHITPQKEILEEMNNTVRQTKRYGRVEKEAEANAREAKGKATAAIETATGESKSTKLRADGKAYELKKQGEGEAKAAKAKMAAELEAMIEQLGDRDDAKKALPILYILKGVEKIGPEIIKSLSNLKMTMVSVDGIEKVSNLIKSFSSLFTSEGGE